MKADSVETLIIPTREAAFDPFVIETIRKAKVLWIAGGNQADYVVHWKGTPVIDAIHGVIAGGRRWGGRVLGSPSWGASSTRRSSTPGPRAT